MDYKKWHDQFENSSYGKNLTGTSSSWSSFFSLGNPLKYGSAFIVAILIVGILWYISLPGDVPDQALTTIKAPTEPFKIKPEADPSDEEKSKTIYEKLTSKTSEEKVEHLLKEPEEPIAFPPSLPDDFIGNLLNQDELQEELSDAESLSLEEKETFSQAPQASPAQRKKSIQEDKNKFTEEQAPSTSFSSDKKKTSPSEMSKTANEEPSLNKTINKEQPLTRIKEIKKNPPLSVEESSKSSETLENGFSPKGEFWVQLASLKTKEAAEREWKRLIFSSKTKPLLGSLKPSYNIINMGQEGQCYRLRVGPFSAAYAKDLCAKLKSLKVECLVKKIAVSSK